MGNLSGFVYDVLVFNSIEVIKKPDIVKKRSTPRCIYGIRFNPAAGRKCTSNTIETARVLKESI